MTDEIVMTAIETTRLTECEAIIERGLKTFVDVGLALMEIRDNRYYRLEYATFEDYCRDRWEMVASRARQLIAASEVMKNIQSVTMVTLLPETERQARPLASLEPEQQREAWAWAVETAPDGKITGAHVQAVVDKLIANDTDDIGDIDDTDGLGNGCHNCKFYQSHGEDLWCTLLERPTYWEHIVCDMKEWKSEYEEEEKRPHVANNSGNNEWYTPPEYIEAARRVMGTIDLDPASSNLANKTVGASIFFTAEDDGLKYSWDGRVWMNPPYSSELIGKFTEKLAKHYTSGEVTEAIVLVNNATETEWFQSLLDIASCVCFPKRRIKFIDENGNPSGAPLQGQAVLYLGNNTDLFSSAFSSFGKVLYG